MERVNTSKKLKFSIRRVHDMALPQDAGCVRGDIIELMPEIRVAQRLEFLDFLGPARSPRRVPG